MGLIDRLYRYWHPHVVDPEEIAFYRQMIIEADGSALELACGSGRLLLQFARENFPVEGVEGSIEMVKILRERIARLKLDVKVYQQKIDEIELQKRYRLLYISLGSFQFVADELNIKLALAKYHELLVDGGKLIIPLFIPWTDLAAMSPTWKIASDTYSKSRDCRFVRREMCTHDAVEQVINTQIRYEMWKQKELLELTEKNMRIRWYSKGEFIAYLKEAGFSNIEMMRSYGVSGKTKPDFMLFIATKNPPNTSN